METKFVIKHIDTSKYLGEEQLGSIGEAIWWDSIEEAEDILKTEDLSTGHYEIVKIYYIDAEQRKEDEEYSNLQRHIACMTLGIKDGLRIQNGEGTNWVGYFRYSPARKEKIKQWFTHNDIEFSQLKKDKYYKVTGWDKIVEEVNYDYITEHIRQYTLETRDEWIHSRI